MTGDRPHHESPYPLPLAVDLREYIEALFREKERALDMAAAERDRAAEVLRDEQRRALLVAEAEREKAAAALRAGTDRAIADNYARLHEKIEGVVRTIEEGDRHRRELEVAASKALENAFDASEKAVAKAETAQQRVNETQNEFRGSLSDQAANLMPRKEFQVLHDGLAERVSNLENSRAGTEGSHAGSGAVVGYFFAAAGLIIAATGIAVGIVIRILG